MKKMKKMMRMMMCCISALCVLLAMVACSSADDSGTPPVDVNTQIVGKWRLSKINGNPVLTNNQMVQTYTSLRTCTYSYMWGTGLSDTANQASGTYNAMFTMLTDQFKAPSGDHQMVYNVSSMTQNEMVLQCTATDLKGGPIQVNSTCVYEKVTNDFSKDIVGNWHGVDAGGETLGNANHRFTYNADGTFIYYSRDEDGNWQVPPGQKELKYFVDGDFLATTWIDADNVQFFECWQIKSISGNRMEWYALRVENGMQFPSTFVMERE